METATKRRLHSLQVAVISSIFFALVIPFIFAIAIERQMAEQRARKELESDIGRSSQVLALSLTAPLWELSSPAVEAIVRAMIQDERFVSISVNERSMNTPFFQLRRSHAEAPENILSRKESISREGEEFGSVEVSMTITPYLDSSREHSQRNLILLATILTMALLAITAVLRRNLLKPVEKLAIEARRIADADLATPISLQDNTELGRVAISMEYMRKRLLETFDELQQKNSQLSDYALTLESRVNERTAELQRTLDSLKQAQHSLVESEKLASLGRLVAGVAHELNTPIGNAVTVATTLNTLSDELSSMVESGKLQRSQFINLMQRVNEGHVIVQRNLERAAEIISNFKQLSVDQTTDMRRKFDLAQVIEEVLTSIQPSFKHSPIHIEADLAPEISMDSYPGPLGQVITNIALNALNHAFEGRNQGTVSITSTLSGYGDSASIICRDDGIGMNEETRLKVFDPFFTTKMGRGGTGLGLHLSYTYVTGLLGGKIEVNSTPGNGTSVVVTIPLKAAAPQDE